MILWRLPEILWEGGREGGKEACGGGGGGNSGRILDIFILFWAAAESGWSDFPFDLSPCFIGRSLFDWVRLRVLVFNPQWPILRHVAAEFRPRRRAESTVPGIWGRPQLPWWMRLKLESRINSNVPSFLTATSKKEQQQQQLESENSGIRNHFVF